ncbi:LysR substrate-binding domain-containing protein [Mycolicibacterium aubagnense]|uniref:LysR substrate-binding domain-containing protein n=1 Tax=Mycolicibacterium aubagnense TaxID=319707 RepID=A0ABN5YWG9_9MYCO|nr:LysR substrate-binding domain-containing protein [Mycolicibacterium aubagnense]TLH68503.1 hypothetical protein C1S80_03585 [Mycolicibacterium aubagnense]WGI32214.1 LysR substrate-binding domain-containing protein [Mycolicibacterium aubagnense]BBX86240.1 hypothetical protein MAUB_41130 [Mycolicibacterium aubagnense]
MRLMFEEPMVFVCRNDHPMASKKEVSLIDPAEEDLIGFPPDWGFRCLMDNAFLAAGVQSRPVHVIPAASRWSVNWFVKGWGPPSCPRRNARSSTICARSH